VITAVTVHLLTQNLKDNLFRARKSEAQWRSLVENAPDLIFNLRPDGTIDFLNRTAEPSNTNMIGHTIYEFTHPDFHNQIQAAINHVLTTGKPSSCEALGRRQSGEYGWYANRLGAVKLQDTITGITMISTDISKRRAMEIALASERDFAQSIIDNMGQGLTLTDENGRFAYVNPAYTHMTGYTVDTLVGKTPYDLVSPEAYEHLKQQATVRRAGKTSTYASQIQHTDGHIVHVFITGVPRWQDNKYIGSIAVVTDLTEQMEAEMEREQLIAELESRNVELERFTYTVSHDLKSPLITIRGFLGVLAQDLERGNAAGVQTAVQHINYAAQKMEALLRDLLALSRVGRIIKPPEETPFAMIVEEALLLVFGQIDANNVQIEVADDLPTVLVDRPRLVEAMQNLLDNAIKFSYQQAQPRIKVGSTLENGEIRFFVQDNGVGIAPQYQHKVFGLFERLDSSVEGTGIGLALVKRIIEVHNGRLWVESAGEGQGSTFLFTLPLANSENEIGLS
jgi:PAS domain S-box-containing protein